MATAMASSPGMWSQGQLQRFLCNQHHEQPAATVSAKELTQLRADLVEGIFGEPGNRRKTDHTKEGGKSNDIPANGSTLAELQQG